MKNRRLTSNVFSDSMMDNLQSLTDMSMEFYSGMLDNMTANNTMFSRNAAQLSRNALRPLKAMLNTGDCCPPEQKCPPHCIATLAREAFPGERIVVPFQVYNDCNSPRTYRIGIRELLDQDGKVAPAQPDVNKNSISLGPHARERVLLRLDLGKFSPGEYSTEIVLREKEYNQNICLTVTVTDAPGPVVTPFEEKQFKLKWQSWRSHYYCEPAKPADNKR